MRYLTALLLFTLYIESYSQSCIPEYEFTSGSWFSPDPSIGENFESAIVGDFYHDVFHMLVPQNANVIDPNFVIPLDSIVVDAVVITDDAFTVFEPGDLGLEVNCYNSDPTAPSCTFLSGNQYCIAIEGVPTGTGQFFMTIEFTAWITVFGVAVAQPYSISEYILEILEFCDDENACNYGESENCSFPEEPFLDCSGQCENDSDGDGICDELEISLAMDGLVAYHPFESIDLSLDFAPTQGTYTAVEDRFGNMSAAEFDGEALIFESTSTAVPNTSFTFSLWSHLDGGEVLSTAIHPVWGQTFGSGESNAGTGIWMDSENIKVVEHSAAYLRKAIEFGYDFTGWHHLVVTYQFNEVSLFVDGQLVANNSHDGRTIHAPLGRDDYSNYVNFGLGMGYGSTSWESEWEQNTFQGALDEFAVWNRVLTPEEILGMFIGEFNSCTDAMACNYNPLANIDDGSCDYCFCGEGTQWVDSLQACMVTEAALMQACGEGTYWDDLTQACLTIDTCQEDLDGDGVIGVNDLLELLSSFGTECAPEPEIAEWTCGDPVNYHGYDYATVQIGEQCWFAENLRTETYRNGDTIPSTLSDSEWIETTLGGTTIYGEGNSYCGENLSPDGNTCDETWSIAEYGRLYNWYSVIDGRGLCPSGWHVPEFDEWSVMDDLVDGVANKLKTTYGWHNSGSGSNESGFSGLPGGLRNSYNGGFSTAGHQGAWWASSSGDFDNSAWEFWLRSDEEIFGWSGTNLTTGLSVRCLQDSE